MLFVEPRFIVFFFVVFLSYWSIRSNRFRKVFLVVSSYAFYAAWDYRFLSLIMLSTIIDYLAAKKIEHTRSSRPRKYWLLVSLTSNLGILFFFKYFNFFARSFTELMQSFEINVSYNTLNIILPVGISFYTFQTLSYTIDVYKNNINARKNLLDLAVYVAFFPQLVAGPIVRATEFLPQLDSARRFSSIPVKACLLLFLIGFTKKVCISDNIAPYVDLVFANPSQYTTGSIYTAVLLYAGQIYCDFSGYSDMAIAVAGLLGYQLPLNFQAPYFSHNLSEFWRRWHISLSSWLRDYLYISLGGNRKGQLKTFKNLMVTMLLGGLWHGASWNFIIWGALHGVVLSVARIYHEVRGNTASSNIFITQLSTIFTFYFVCLAWIFFRSANLDDALTIAKVWLFISTGSGQQSLQYDGGIFLVPIIISLHWLFARLDVLSLIEQRVSGAVFGFCFGTAVALAIAFVPTGNRPFIYFQF